MTVCAYVTCNKYIVSVTRQFFDRLAAYLLLGMDEQSFKNILKLESNSKVFFQSVPLLILSTLIFTGYLQCDEMLEGKSLVTTFAVNILSIVGLFATKYLDKLAADESFVFHFYEGMTAYINWLPHLNKI